ncbi:uncharacterized protein LOC108672540 isoform X2 [Hyalella azteca]|uniref:Uncharacterized protein LOC108672540 isoform X2 n=1 Tax=Hyalella azteca TaxID=294128 RepID=A0A8B7NPR9_HYAAZ|nr:uncharacterized protein LOC108672540 isoform X2 [Hyalella azteca]
MESGSYKEFQPKANTPRFTAILITCVTVILCLLIGIGSWILVTGTSDNALPIDVKENTIEKVIIIESADPSTFVEKKGSELERSILSDVQDVLKYDQQEFPKGGDISEGSFLKPDFPKSRQRRSLASAVGLQALKYMNYLSFGRFMLNEVYSITEFTTEGRKLSGDADAFFLDSGYDFSDNKKSTDNKIEKSDTTAVTTSTKTKPNKRPPSAYDNGWTPMVNKVSLKFITDMLTTLLNLMREYLMKDHVMECLWFMFCKDMNHQAKYSDPMGYLARINSVGLKVLTDKEGRETDTVSSVWRALTDWEPLECDAMFPKCDGTKALEIVNEVANASRK